MLNLKKTFVFIFLLFLIIIYFWYFRIKKNKCIVPQISTLPQHIWLYWETKKGHTKPEYIDLCQLSIKQNCKKDFNIHVLDQTNVYKYFPEMRKDLGHLSIPQKTDYIRLYALVTHGGIWLDSDMIVFKSLLPLLEKLRHYDFAGFGCHDLKCNLTNNGYGKPANWAMISRKNGRLVRDALRSADDVLDSSIDLTSINNYHKLGRELLWNSIKKLKKESWDYYHFDSTCFERDKYGNKYTNERLISNESIDARCDYYFMPMYNTAPGFPKWFIDMNKTKLLKSNTLFSKLINVALNS